jgi:putative transposase
LAATVEAVAPKGGPGPAAFVGAALAATVVAVAPKGAPTKKQQWPYDLPSANKKEQQMSELPRNRAGQASLRRHRVSLPGHVYHLTTATEGRQRLFTDFPIARAAIRALHDPAVLRDTQLIAWVLMPDHLHVLLQLGEGDSLSALMNRVKAAIARAVKRQRVFPGAVWQRAYHDHLLREEEDLRAVGRYIVMNPLRAGLVQRVSDYPHWDAVWL